MSSNRQRFDYSGGEGEVMTNWHEITGEPGKIAGVTVSVAPKGAARAFSSEDTAHEPITDAEIARLKQESAEKTTALVTADREIARLREALEAGRKTIRRLEEQAHRRNVELDALHYVWCNGGCAGGVHRWCRGEGPITKEHLDVAEKNMARMREWLRNHEYRLARTVPTAAQPKEKTDERSKT